MKRFPTYMKSTLNSLDEERDVARHFSWAWFKTFAFQVTAFKSNVQFIQCLNHYTNLHSVLKSKLMRAYVPGLTCALNVITTYRAKCKTVREFESKADTQVRQNILLRCQRLTVIATDYCYF